MTAFIRSYLFKTFRACALKASARPIIVRAPQSYALREITGTAIGYSQCFSYYIFNHSVELSSVVLELTSMSTKFQDQEKLIITLLIKNGLYTSVAGFRLIQSGCISSSGFYARMQFTTKK